MSDMESIQINLNSKFADRYVNNSLCNAVFELPNINIPNEHHIHISVVNCIIPYSFYNINLSNNILIYIVNGVSYTVNITIGNYNAIQLALYFQSNMAGFNCIYNSITNKYTFSSTANFSFSPISSCLKILGFVYTDSVNNSLTSFNCVNLQSVQCLHIQSNFLTGNINSSNIYLQNTLATIPVNSQPNSNIVYENNGSVFTTNLYSNILSEISIKIVDQDNNIIDTNGLHWSITLQMDIVDFVN